LQRARGGGAFGIGKPTACRVVLSVICRQLDRGRLFLYIGQVKLMQAGGWEMSTTLHKVKYFETDQSGFVHHSNYFRWFEDARVEALPTFGLSYSKMEEAGFIGVVVSASCEYRRAVRFGQTVEIVSQLKEMDERFMLISYLVRDADSGKERAYGETKLCFVGLDGKMISLKEADPELYASILRFLDE
jgi:acyl-CoA thioester hydrolase